MRDFDEDSRSLHELKNEVRRLRKALHALSVSHCGAPNCSCCAFMRREAAAALGQDDEHCPHGVLKGARCGTCGDGR
jgi:hypothetical protein